MTVIDPYGIIGQSAPMSWEQLIQQDPFLYAETIGAPGEVVFTPYN